mmetsp:Transcript_72343/g.204450  ORF Transcript_72343/g.204450 Transcript_72343/m.204450 type:complete len:113 (-) Transcript_72343:207-545(-)|eukprot:CAMPEP_0179261676 /NCGR_PEP_ID=MMETSP0797-20121207/26983_1 /TAXON_ID=47934 /ORGANISM="Dinophysis acuminata, Strain DAEP01" /LENGTH=112 /DNA_ID=CAMNT_0020969805 /DNA_START=68 /DNA_END=406 /DNA_ORIENTATION=+
MPEITANVSFDKIAREWRCKWSEDNDKASLTEVQKVMEGVIEKLKALPGCVSVQRVVCGGCHDYKLVTQLSAEKFGDWDGQKFAPETEVLDQLKKIDGVTQVETQTYTLMTM